MSSDFGTRSDRSRKPTKGIRVKLRTALKEAGVNVKFRTHELRNHKLMVTSDDEIIPPFTEFGGREVVFSTHKTLSQRSK